MSISSFISLSLTAILTFKVSGLEDNISTLQDVTIKDATNSQTGALASTSPVFREIKIYTDAMAGYFERSQTSALIHELGHALGLAHRNERGTVMDPVVNPLIELSKADKISYDAAYNNY